MATFNKLRDGSWGVRSTVEVKPGDVVTVTKRDGASVPQTIKAIVWSGNGVWLCSVEPKDSAPAPAASKPRARTSGCPRCCRTATRRAQVFEECDSCGTEPIYV